MKKLLFLILILSCSTMLALTPNEKKIVQHAQAALAQAQKNYKDQQIATAEAERQAEEARNEAQQAKENAAQTATNLGQLQGEIKDAAKREGDLVTRVNELQSLEKQVNSYWGIGAITYGFKRLAKHIFILIAVLAGLALAIFVLSFFFPFLIPFIKMIGNFLAMIFRKIADLFKRK